jgi:hypothetical protein
VTTQQGRDQQVIGLVEFAGRVLHTGETLGNAATVIDAVDPGGVGFGTDTPGALGELHRHLYDAWASALHARTAEAQRHGARLVELAEHLGKVAANYAETDITLSTRIARAESDSGPDVLRHARPERHSVTVWPDQGAP